MNIVKTVEALVQDQSLSYAAIVDLVKVEFPHAKTTTKSVASIASDLRRRGVLLPSRVYRVPVQMEMSL